VRPLALAALLLVFAEPARAECVIPPGPPCLPFDDPRWEDPSCKVSVGSCWHILTETIERPLITKATVRITPICNDPESGPALRDAAFKVLSKLDAYEIEVTATTGQCSSSGHADIKIG